MVIIVLSSSKITPKHVLLNQNQFDCMKVTFKRIKSKGKLILNYKDLFWSALELTKSDFNSIKIIFVCREHYIHFTTSHELNDRLCFLYFFSVLKSFYHSITTMLNAVFFPVKSYLPSFSSFKDSSNG